ncbi:MAG: hypothetical protein SGJ24_05010, partial [Chloroflexota bacterium]|nr:hypothetical protein [Chloroflexota bacterium]
PTHLLLAIGMGLVFTGAMRSAWTRFPTREAARGWRDLGAMILGAALTLTLVMFFVSYGNPIVNPAPLLDFPTAFGMRDAMQDFGVTGVVFTAALFAAVVSLLAWRWRLPFGTFVVLFVVPTALLTVLNDFYPLIVPALVAGVIADVAYALLRPSPERGGRYLLFCGLAPLVYFSLYMVTLSALEPLRWSVHVWTGAAFLSGVVGVLLAGVISSAHSGTAVVD